MMCLYKYLNVTKPAGCSERNLSGASQTPVRHVLFMRIHGEHEVAFTLHNVEVKITQYSKG